MTTKQVGPRDEATYVADVTAEDGTIFEPGASFVKTWRVRNTGTTTWDARYTLRWIDHERMDGPDSVPLNHAVAPGEVATVSVPLTAPAAPGRWRSTWQLHDPAGNPFDFDLYAEIQVPKQPLTPDAGLDELRWIADVTIPDGDVHSTRTALYQSMARSEHRYDDLGRTLYAALRGE